VKNVLSVGVTLLGLSVGVRRSETTPNQGRVIFLGRCIAAAAGLTTIVTGADQAWAGLPAPAPLIGVTGPYGLLAAGAAYGGYRLFRHFRKRSQRGPRHSRPE
jgi:hypothetical protein